MDSLRICGARPEQSYSQISKEWVLATGYPKRLVKCILKRAGGTTPEQLTQEWETTERIPPYGNQLVRIECLELMSNERELLEII